MPTFSSGVEIQVDEDGQWHDQNQYVSEDVDPGCGEVGHGEVVAAFGETWIPCAPGFAVAFEGLVGQRESSSTRLGRLTLTKTQMIV